MELPCHSQARGVRPENQQAATTGQERWLASAWLQDSPWTSLTFVEAVHSSWHSPLAEAASYGHRVTVAVSARRWSLTASATHVLASAEHCKCGHTVADAVRLLT